MAAKREVLGIRCLNRTMLRRQWLDHRRRAGVVEAVGHLVGLNAQSPEVPAPALAARLDGFEDTELWDALAHRRLVRSVVMRGTQHIVAPEDFTLLRSALTSHLERIGHNVFRDRLAGAAPAGIADRARELLESGRRWTRPELGRALGQFWPDALPSALGWMSQYVVPVVHPTDGVWEASAAAPIELPPLPVPPPDEATVPAVVERYLAAFGPALPADIRAWCGLAGIGEVLSRMADRLVTFADERGRVLYDLPELGLAHPDDPAPVRFLPAFDAPLLAYHDRTRIMSDAVRAQVCQGDAVHPSVLVDGFVSATWRRVPDGVEVRMLRELTELEVRAVVLEGETALGSAVRVL